MMYYLTKFNDMIDIKWFLSYSKKLHLLICASQFTCSFESRKCGKEGENLQKFEYLENEKLFR